MIRVIRDAFIRIKKVGFETAEPTWGGEERTGLEEEVGDTQGMLMTQAKSLDRRFSRGDKSSYRPGRDVNLISTLRNFLCRNL